ncbi:hypothetical protein [Mesorhizobium sp. M0239]|uniref:hypothetical protein n=1 Tax=Mesorhizobium sp. M0239 TaxID=2956924 RepID=UPI00333CEE56
MEPHLRAYRARPLDWSIDRTAPDVGRGVASAAHCPLHCGCAKAPNAHDWDLNRANRAGGHLAFAYLPLAGLAAIANLIFRMRTVGLVWLAFSLIYVPFSCGAADSLRTISNMSAATTEVETDKGVISGRILRMTSGFAIIFDGKAIVVLPLNKVRNMRRLYTATPEIDYLEGGTPN